ncbi:MAG: hypothetical protein AB2693_08840 [Candidatus Thiodiazotropha sp.]
MQLELPERHKDSRNHRPDSRSHSRDSHSRSLDSHNHSQDSHNHSQDSHSSRDSPKVHILAHTSRRHQTNQKDPRMPERVE